MQKWEYEIVPYVPSPQLAPMRLAETFNERGAEGWELITIMPVGPMSMAIFKRPKP
jgi:hypothetical protein